METPTPEAVFSYLQWRAAEEETDAEFLEQCANKFDAVREPFLLAANVHRTRAENIRANLDVMFGPRILGIYVSDRDLF